MNFQAPEGTYDVVPFNLESKDSDDNRRQIAYWNKLESAARECFNRFGYEEVRPSIIEYTNLFYKSSGEATDIVEKEMFTFEAWAHFVDELSFALVQREYRVPLPFGLLGDNLIRVTRNQNAPYDHEVAVNHALRLIQQVAWGPTPNALSGSQVLEKLTNHEDQQIRDFWCKLPDKKKIEVAKMFDHHLKTRLASLSLRPELTPGTIRALIEQGLFAKKNFWKVWYLGPAFRKERPQKGRYRQFTQIGVEAVGSPDPLVDAETMVLFAEILKAVGVGAWELRINSIGCKECRPAYRDALKEYIRPKLSTLDENCQRRFERNVFRILDCKVDAEKLKDAPKAVDHLCQNCKAHMAVVEKALQACAVPYRIDPRIVRGLDYYTRTVYEFSSSALGAQNALAGGGRYDTLVGSMGGPDVGSVGFAAGVERILLAMGGDAPAPVPDFYAIAAGDVARDEVFKTVVALRRAGLSGDLDFEARSVKAQMRSANKSGARYALFIGPDEAAKGAVKLKDMKDGVEQTVPLDEAVRKLQGGKS